MRSKSAPSLRPAPLRPAPLRPAPLRPALLRPASSRAGGLAAGLALAGLQVAGCTAPAAAGLSDDDANRVVVALERAGVDSAREPDPQVEGRFRVLVARDDAPHAAGVLRDEELPPRASPGLLDSMGKGSLVPSGAVEHAQLIAGLAGELERTLAGIDGVVSARVHVSIPPPDLLGERAPRRPSASVLLKHRGASAPIDPGAVQRLVAGAISGMMLDDVAVVLLARPSAPASPDRQLIHVGPIAVTRGSVAYLRALVAVAITLSVLPTTALLALWLRGRRQATSEET